MNRSPDTSQDPDAVRGASKTAAISLDTFERATPDELVKMAEERGLLGEPLKQKFFSCTPPSVEESETWIPRKRSVLNKAFLKRERTEYPDRNFYAVFDKTDEANPKARQNFVTMLATAHEMYFNKAGASVSMEGYLCDHYAPLCEEGLTIHIETEKADDVRESMERSLEKNGDVLITKTSKAFEKLSGGQSEIPVLILEFKGKTKRIPILYSDTIDMEVGSLAAYCFKDVGEVSTNDAILIDPTRYLSTGSQSLLEIAGALLHEMDHAIFTLVKDTEYRRESAALSAQAHIALHMSDESGMREIVPKYIEAVTEINRRHDQFQAGRLVVMEGLAVQAQRAFLETQGNGFGNNEYETAPAAEFLNVVARYNYWHDSRMVPYATGDAAVGLVYDPSNFKDLYMTDFLDRTVAKNKQLLTALEARMEH